MNSLKCFGLSNTCDKPATTLVSGVQRPINIKQNVDAFGRLRVSLPATQYEYNFQYDTAPLIWDQKIEGTGSAIHQSETSSILLITGSEWIEDVVKLVGYGDAENGIFMGQDKDGVFLLLRSFTNGLLVDDSRKVYQSEWNIDVMDGGGKSGIILDISKGQIFICELAWLGLGQVRCYLDINGSIHPIHEFLNSNIVSSTYITSANLPIRYEISDGVNSVVRQTFQYFRYRPGKSLQVMLTFNMYEHTVADILQICATVITETSNDIEAFYEHSVNTGVVAKQVLTNRTPLISIRPKATFNSVVNRSQISCEKIDIALNEAGLLLWELIYLPPSITADPLHLGGADWMSADASATFEYDILATAITAGGIVIDSGYCLSTNVSRTGIQSSVSAKFPITLDMEGENPACLSLVATAAAGSLDTFASLTAKSYY
jgi:hypothetical protein